MDNLLSFLVTMLMSGGPQAIIALLVLIVSMLLFDRRRLLNEITKRDDKIDHLVDDYYRGNLTLSEALNSLKFVLFEIKARF